MRSLRLARLVGVLTLASLLPAAASAQVKLDFTPYLGLYLPLANVVDQTSQGGGTAKQDLSYVIGGRVAVWPSSRIGIEASVGYSGSGVTVNFGGNSADTSGHVFVANVRALIGLTPGTTGCFEFVKGMPTHCLPALYLTGGLGLVSHGGDGWSGVTGTSDFGAQLGIGYRLPITSTLALRLEAEVFLYSIQVTSGGVTANSKFQQDGVLSAGLAIPLGGR